MNLTVESKNAPHKGVLFGVMASTGSIFKSNDLIKPILINIDPQGPDSRDNIPLSEAEVLRLQQ